MALQLIPMYENSCTDAAFPDDVDLTSQARESRQIVRVTAPRWRRPRGSSSARAGPAEDVDRRRDDRNYSRSLAYFLRARASAALISHGLLLLTYLLCLLAWPASRRG